MSILERLQKQASELDAKGALRTKHEELTLSNLQKKIEAVTEAIK